MGVLINCSECGHAVEPRTGYCANCGSWSLDFSEPVAQDGQEQRVYSYPRAQPSARRGAGSRAAEPPPPFADPLASAPPPPASARFPAPPPESEPGFMPPPPPGSVPQPGFAPGQAYPAAPPSGFPPMPPPSGFPPMPPPTGFPTAPPSGFPPAPGAVPPAGFPPTPGAVPPSAAGWAAPRASERVETVAPPVAPQFADTVVVEPIRVDTVRETPVRETPSRDPLADAPPPRSPLRDTFPEDTDPLDATRMVNRASRTRPWTITLPDGTLETVSASIILGRAATEVDDWPGARLISIDDPTRSISKNHAVFAEKFGMFVVEDLGSTNGIIIVRPDGVEQMVPPFGRADIPEGATVELGAVVLRVGRVAPPPHRF